MRVVFDICVPRPLRKHLPGHEILTAQELGWDTLQNGDLIRAAEPLFDVLVTSVQNIEISAELVGAKAGHSSVADKLSARSVAARAKNRTGSVRNSRRRFY